MYQKIVFVLDYSVLAILEEHDLLMVLKDTHSEYTCNHMIHHPFKKMNILFYSEISIQIFFIIIEFFDDNFLYLIQIRSTRTNF